MSTKAKIFKKLISVLCAATVATSCVAPSVGAINEKQIQDIVEKMDACNNRVKDFEEKKAKINKEKENKIKKLDSEIKDSEQLLEYLLNLIADGEDHEVDCNRVERSIEDNKQKKVQISDDSAKEIHDIDELINQSNIEKTRLERELNDLFNQQDVIPRPNNQIQLENELKEAWKQIASGCQYDPKGKYESLCWLMCSRNVLNFFGLEEEQAKPPIQGVQNVIDDYLKRRENLPELNNEMQGDICLGQWLNKNQISTLNVTDCVMTGDFNNENEAKRKLIEVVKDQIATHFDAKNKPYNRMSPIITGKYGHWITIVGYDKNTNNVVIVDSLNGYKSDSKISIKNIDELIEQKLITKQGAAQITELIFTAKRDIVDSSDYYLSSANNFYEHKDVKDQISKHF